MPYPTRKDFIARTAVERRAQNLSVNWTDAQRRAYNRNKNFREAVDAMGDFTLNAIDTAIEEVRETYDAGMMTYNLVTDVIESDCEDKWTMLLTTALPAAGEALWLLLTPSPGEILQEYLQPKGLKSAGRGGRDSNGVRRKTGSNGTSRRRFPRIPNVDKLIADRIPGSQWVQGRNVGNFQKWLFNGVQVADRVFWQWLVLEATETFFTTWSSGIMESRFCQSPLTLQVTGAITSPVAHETVRNFAIPPWEPFATKGLAEGASGLGWFDRAFDATIAFSLTFKVANPFNQDVTLTVNLSWWQNGVAQPFIPFTKTLAAGADTLTVSGSADLASVTLVQIGWAAFGLGTEITTADFAAFGTDATV